MRSHANVAITGGSAGTDGRRSAHAAMASPPPPAATYTGRATDARVRGKLERPSAFTLVRLASGLSHHDGRTVPELQEVLPKFLQIANHIRDEILRGERSPGDEVPSERVLAGQWNVSRPTATRALQALRAQGLIESRQGSGTYVRDRLKFNRRARDRYLRSRSDGYVYAPNEWAEIVSARLVRAPARVAESLGVPIGDRVVKRHRITNDDEGPVEVSTSWFTAAVAEQAPNILVRERIREGTLAYVEACTGRRARSARDQLGTRLASIDELRELHLDEPAAVLIVHHIVYDANERPLEVAEAVYPPDRWTFEQDYPITD
jgi:DNA-binding GntR family transcriptional regulator